MGIFCKRPFAFALFLLIASSVTVYALTASGILITYTAACLYAFIALFAAVAIAVITLIVLAIRVPLFRVRFVTGTIALCFFMIGFLRSGDFFVRSYLPLQQYVGETVTVTATIREREASTAGYARYRVEVSSVLFSDGTRTEEAFPAVLVFDSVGAYAVGDCITASVKGCALSDIYPYPSFAQADGYAVGFLYEENSDGEISVERETAKGTFFDRVTRLGQGIQTRLSFILSEGIGGDAGALASAVLLGDKSGLPMEISRDFGRAGIAHLLALSGLHMSILIGGAVLVLKKLGLHRRVVSVLTLVMILGFLWLTGFSMSACRAGLMLAFAALLGFFSRRSDSVTALFFAVAIVLLVYPSAVASVGLWMSFSSVLGLIVLMPRVNVLFHVSKTERRGFRSYVRRLLYAGVLSVLVTVIASFSVLPVLYLSGGEFPLLFVVANLLTVFLMPPFLVLSLAFLALRRVVLFGWITRTLLRLSAGWIVGVAREISALPKATVSLSYAFVGAVLLVFLLPTLFLLCMPPRFFADVKAWIGGRKREEGERVREIGLRWFALPPISACILYAVCLSVHLSALAASPALPVSVLSVSGGEVLTVTDGASSVLVDLSTGYYTGYRAAETEASVNGCTEWSHLVLTECRFRHLSTVPRFCRTNLVREVLLPTPSSEKEELYADGLVERLTYYGISYRFYERGACEQIADGISFTLSQSEYIKRSQQPIFLFTLSGRERLIYLSQAVEESALHTDALDGTARADVVLYGSRGPNRHTVYPVMASKDGTRLVLLYGEANARCVLVDHAAYPGVTFRYDEKSVRLWEK